MSEPKLTPGQTLIFVGRYRHNNTPTEVTVEKVGRVWVTLSNHQRMRVGSLTCDGGKFSSPGHCYLSREDLDLERSNQALWTKLQTQWDEGRYRWERVLSASDMHQISDILRLAKARGEP